MHGQEVEPDTLQMTSKETKTKCNPCEVNNIEVVFVVLNIAFKVCK